MSCNYGAEKRAVSNSNVSNKQPIAPPMTIRYSDAARSNPKPTNTGNENENIIIKSMEKIYTCIDKICDRLERLERRSDIRSNA